MSKVIDNLMSKIYKMEFPCFIDYDFMSKGAKCVPFNCSRNFLWSLATDTHRRTLEMTLEQAILDACQYAYWGKFEYEHWVDNKKIEEDGYYEQFIRWAYDDEKANWFNCKDKEPIGLRTWLQNHPITKLWEKARAKELKKNEKKQGVK